MIKSKKLSRFKNIKHGFFNKLGGKSTGIFKSLNCGPGSTDKQKNIKKPHKTLNFLLKNSFTLVTFKIFLKNFFFFMFAN